jgi:hypothetical protein
MASMSDITATPLGHTDFTLSTVTPAPRQQQRRQQQLQQQQQRVRQLYDSTPGHDGTGDSSSGVTAEQRQQQQQQEFDSVLQVSAA